MYIRRRVSRGRSLFGKHGILLFFLAGLACLLALVFSKAIRNFAAITPLKAVWAYEEEPARRNPSAKYQRIVYPYSVIPGGLHNREDLISSMNRDRIVAAHFADFNVGQARIVKAQETKFLYVSYRVRNKVFWTVKTVRVSEGEALITDGRSAARARCGNRLSAVPREPVSEEEPMNEAFDVPMLARMESPGRESGSGIREPFRLNPDIPIQYPVTFWFRSGSVLPRLIPGASSLLATTLKALVAVGVTKKK